MPTPGGQAALSSCSAAIAIVGVMIAAAASYIVGARHGRLQQQQQQQRQEEEDYHHRKVVLDGRNNDIVGLDEEVIESKEQKMQQRISARAESRIFFRSLSNNHHEETKGGSSNVTDINDNSSSINNNKDEMNFQIDRHTKQHVNDDDDDEVCIVEVISPMECISRVKSIAEIKNEIIVISDDDDDDNDDDDDDDETVTHATPTPTRGVKIKIEPNNYNANVASTMNYKSKTNNSVHPSSSSSSIIILPPIQPVATLSSVYRLCVGTPRQGMLVPTSRGIITFDSNIVSRDSILELEGYSHVYVLFAFHLNNNLSSSTNSDSNNIGGGKGEGDSISKTTKKRQQHQFTSKIAPPSLGGKKVGIFATRTPHRPNPIGISLCKLDRVIINQGYGGGDDVTMKGGGKKSKKFNKNNSNHNNNSSFMLLLSGLDLVDGTPILDIKPYVPHYDCVGYADQQLNGNTTPASTATLNAKTITHGNDIDDSTLIVNNNSILHNQTLSLSSSTVGKEGGDDDHSHVKVPYWVESGLQKRRNVTLLPKAKQFLHQYQDLVSSVIIDGCNNKSEEEIPTSSSSSLLLQRLQFYGTHTPWNDTPQYAIQCLERCIIDTLSCDVRSAWQTDKARKGKFQAERSVRLGGGGGQQQRPQQSGSEGDDNNMNSNVDINNDNDQPQRLCTQQIDNVLVSYTVGKSDQHIDERSEGSGAEDVVVVHTISFIE